MAVNTYKAQLNYYDHTYGWGNVGTCAQGDGRTWGAGSARTGVMYFPGLSNLKGKIINSVKITVTNRAGGQNAQKTAHFFRSASQGGINTSLGANHKTGSQIGTLTGNFHAYANASLTFTPTFFSQYIALGEDTYCIYSNAAADYLVWSAVTLTVDWSEPATQLVLDKTSVELGQPVAITTAATNSAYRHRLRYSFGSAYGTIAENVEGSSSWTPPVSLASQIPNATSGIGTIYCDTYSGSTLLGTKSVGVTLTVPASVKPTAARSRRRSRAIPPARGCTSRAWARQSSRSRARRAHTARRSNRTRSRAAGGRRQPAPSRPEFSRLREKSRSPRSSRIRADARRRPHAQSRSSPTISRVYHRFPFTDVIRPARRKTPVHTPRLRSKRRTAPLRAIP